MLSGIVTTILLVLFVAGWVWAWSPKRKNEFDAAAQLPLDEDREKRQ
ncbi:MULTISPECIES: cbb3-type cytochrome oxidase subunit 3 [Lysobacter]|jgi:cytochrome c oxidase cbb3-type subunit 4|uniref:Cbb3-type cytochrome c oxidase subunit 3 n=1 Tax=Lysobacter soli TaxID=453783 RepID=A0A3D8VHG2_9GAMM|nr:cbb3-type cytochrome c oxidase subunit 3 [Lysobacter soli]QGW63965.1 CcoQ/FixQ family Cbb3-type cytochrome c oxidase assembly chaperone [Lysobacter soli]RDY68739.1 cbb3-type cytochrome c oxidase subunit 3 [Lysobacter soli]